MSPPLTKKTNEINVIIEEKPKIIRSSIEEFDLKNVQDDYHD